jgi:hypothetical protein
MKNANMQYSALRNEFCKAIVLREYIGRLIYNIIVLSTAIW